MQTAAVVACFFLVASSTSALGWRLAAATDSDTNSIGRAQQDQITDQEPGCPAWLDEYAEFHRSTRGQPQATYLMYGPCHDDMRCTGIGDRIRSSMTLLRLAAIYRKVLLLSWDHVSPLATFLEPAAIDWQYDSTLQEELKDETSDFDTMKSLVPNRRLHRLITAGEHAEEFKEAKFVKSQVVRDFFLDVANQTKEHLNHLDYTKLGRCFFRFLFKPSKLLEDKTDESLRAVYGSEPPPYVAWHWRSGGLVDEPILNRPGTTKVDDSSRLRQLMAATQCARDMATAHGLPPLSATPMLLITDHNLIRQWVAAGALAGVITPNITVVHTRSRSISADEMLEGWVDVGLLSRSSCLLISHSGFSLVAVFMGTTDCHLDLKECLIGQHERFEGYEVRKASL